MVYHQYLFNEKIPLANRALDAYSMRQRTIAKNITNSTSPHYRPEKVKFEEFFHEAGIVESGSQTDGLHIPMGAKNPDDIQGEVNPAPVPTPEIYFSGETHVNVDKEMSQLAQNQIRYKFASKAVKSYFGDMQTAIRGTLR